MISGLGQKGLACEGSIGQGMRLCIADFRLNVMVLGEGMVDRRLARPSGREAGAGGA